MDPAWIIAAISLATVLAGLAAWMLRWAWRIGRRVWEFTDDYFGRPAEHGRPAQPGVMERLVKLETGVAGISDQVHLNSGHSMRDVVQRTEAAVGDLQQSMNGLSEQVGQIKGGQL